MDQTINTPREQAIVDLKFSQLARRIDAADERRLAALRAGMDYSTAQARYEAEVAPLQAEFEACVRTPSAFLAGGQ